MAMEASNRLPIQKIWIMVEFRSNFQIDKKSQWHLLAKSGKERILMLIFQMTSMGTTVLPERERGLSQSSQFTSLI